MSADDVPARSGPFWDAVHGHAPMPPAASTLGFEFVSYDDTTATIEVAFTATEAFTNPAGNVLGAFLAAMLYDTVGPALIAGLDPDQFQSTLEMNTSFLHPVKPGRILGTGHVRHRTDDLAHLEATLTNSAGETIATATATAKIIPISEAPNAV
ncbi:PaaI family thioesterase [Nocardia sp. NPDC058705]|uniref:PaaI family thioesterase n=1 Tax=Nocardia sp. NPDC058705 TaxID=3346609 RepID=UPI0036B7BD64